MNRPMNNILPDVVFHVWEYQEMMTTGIVFLFGGLGLITYYAIVRKKTEHNTPSNE